MKRILVICLVLAMMLSLAVIAFAADVSTEQKKTSTPVALALALDDKIAEDVQTEENVLVLRGDWANESAHRLNAIVNYARAKKDAVRWSVDADSYQNEFGFTGTLTGNDIVAVDETSGKITVKNSGIVRVICEYVDAPENNFSIVVVVPGDVNKDGVVNEADAECAIQLYDEMNTEGGIAAGGYLSQLADMNEDGCIDLQDASAIYDVCDRLSGI